MRGLLDWLDNRTGYRQFVSDMLLEHVPGGAKWRYVWGSCLAFVFGLQLITGILLMTSYSPGDSTAWASVYYIQYQMDFGWLIRGLHHFGSQTMVVLVGLHMLQVVIAGAHLAPREFNWWTGLLLLALVLGLSLTGYLLPWDQKGYWATQVATNIAGSLPVLGTFIQKIVVGGPAYGHHTLTRFFALHVAVLPGLLILLLVVHITLFRRHGVTAGKDAEKEGMDYFYPAQVFKDLVACLLVFAVMLFLVLNGHGHHLDGGVSEDAGLYEQWAKAGRTGLGANLDAPADPSREYPARPEWYFLFLFQLLKYFEGEYFLVGTVIIPNGVGLLLFLLPFFGYGKMRPFGHVLGVVLVVALLASVASLTCLALADDAVDPVVRVLLNRVAIAVVPLIAGLYLIYLGVLAFLKKGGLRSGVFAVGGALLLLLCVATGGLMYTALADPEALPGQVTDFVRGKMRDDEKLPATEVAAAVKKMEAEVSQVKAADQKMKIQEELKSRIPEATQKWGVGVLKFSKDLAAAGKEGARAIELASEGIPAEGPVVLLRNDPKSQFKHAFLKNCASCHSYGEFGGAEWKTTDLEDYRTAKFTAADLAGFGTKEWLIDFLKDPSAPRFYGRSQNEDKSPYFTRMSSEVKRLRRKAAKQGPEEEKKLEADFVQIAEWLALHRLPEYADKIPPGPGHKLFTETYACTSCHKYVSPDTGEEGVPDLTGYGSAKWLRQMLRTPDHPYLYGERNRMPSFRDLEGLTSASDRQEYAKFVGKEVKNLKFSHLSDIDREILIRYLTHDYRVIFGGQIITGVKKDEK